MEPPLSRRCPFGRRPTTSGLPLETDSVRVGRRVSKVPGPDSCTAANSIFIAAPMLPLPSRVRNLATYEGASPLTRGEAYRAASGR